MSGLLQMNECFCVSKHSLLLCIKKQDNDYSDNSGVSNCGRNIYQNSQIAKLVYSFNVGMNFLMQFAPDRYSQKFV